MSKRLWVLPVLVATLVVLGSGAGFASMPSLLGGTGVVTTPNAMVAPMGQIQTALTYQRLEALAIDMYEEGLGTETTSLWGIQALAAVTNGAELWAAYSKDNSEFGTKTWSVGGKYQFPTDSKDVNLAIGAAYRNGAGSFPTFLWEDEFDPDWVESLQIDGDITNWDVYLAATADLTAMGQSDWCSGGRLLGTAGIIYKKATLDMTINWTEYYLGELWDWDSESWTEIDDSLTRPFVSVEYLGQDRTSLGLEYRWKDTNLDAKAIFSAVLRHEFEGGFNGSIGVTNSDQFGFGMDDQNWFAMIGYNFGACK